MTPPAPTQLGRAAAPGLPLAARRHALVGEVARRLAARCGVPAGARIAIGTSGGADSTALLLAAAALRRRRTPPVDPLAVHVNHHLRDAADQDEACVAALCARLGIELQVRHVRPAGRPGNLGAAARELRYQALEEAACSAGARFVAVAHHAEDQLETMLMALGRGAGIQGLCGMPWTRLMAGGCTLVRPLLAVAKSECVSLCRAAAFAFTEDPTNSDPATVRGRLRRDVIAVLSDLWPEAAERAASAADSLAAARAALERDLDARFGDASTRRWDRARLRELPLPVIAAGLRRAAVRAEPGCADDLGHALLAAAAESVADGVRRPRSFQWPGSLRLRVSARQVELTRG
jgi:tRNA(Ile)-lysidine synthase